MLEQIIQDYVGRISASNQPIFRTDIDYEKILKHRNDVVQKWNSLGADDKALFGGQEIFERENGCKNLKDPEVIPAKNVFLVKNEIKKD